MVRTQKDIEKEINIWKGRKSFAVKNKDAEMVHVANNKLIKLNKELKKRAN